jgi:uncharacterized protein (TIGR04551 family)
MPCGRPYVRLSLLITALTVVSSRAHAQDTAHAAPAASDSAAAPAPSAPSPAPAAPADATPAPRPSLVPDAAPAKPVAEPVAPAAAAVANPARDEQELAAQGAQRPNAGDASANTQEIFSDDWWGRARPIVELHGYFRTRAELFHNFALGRVSSTSNPQNLFPMPLDNSYTGPDGTQHVVNACGSATTMGAINGQCNDKTESGANLRLRLSPEIHISDNLRILTQIDLLDNLVLGSTPDAYSMQPAGTTTSATTNGSSGVRYPTGYQPAAVNGYAPIGLLTTTQTPPTAGVNSFTNSIDVKRVWGEYMTPVGQLRFGRMPGHWGLGMVENSGDGIDSDYETTLDRIMFVSGIKSADLYFGGAWDFVSTGPTTASPQTVSGGQPYNTCNLCNVNEWAAFIAHRTNPQMQRLALARGDVVLNGGLYTVFRSQYLDVLPGATPQTTDFTQPAGTLEPRQSWTLTPDLWLQILWQKLRIEAEFATVQGEIGYLSNVGVQGDRRQARPPVRLRLGERRPVDHLAHAAGRVSVADERQRTPPGAERHGADLDVRVPPRLPRRPHLLSTHPVARGGHVLLPTERRLRLPPSRGRRTPRRRRGGHLEPREPVRADAGARERPRGRARRADLLPVEGRLTQRRAGKARGLLHDAPVRRVLSARGARLPPRRGLEPGLRHEFVGRADRPPLPWHRLLSLQARAGEAPAGGRLPKTPGTRRVRRRAQCGAMMK